MSERSETVYSAKLAEVSERYEEMVQHMQDVCVTGKELNVEERNLLSVAYKNVIGSRRASWRILTVIECREGESEDNTEILKDYKKQLEAEIQEYCLKIIELIDTTLLGTIPTSTSESKVYYHKMRADYKRYLTEFKFGPERRTAAEESLVAYKLASELSTSELSSTNPVRLGVALNFAVFYYEIMDNRKRANRLAKAAFDDAAAELDNVSKERYKDTAMMMQLLKNNLEVWNKKMKKRVKKTSESGMSASQVSQASKMAGVASSMTSNASQLSTIKRKKKRDASDTSGIGRF